jgi:hypothetical protein
MAIKGKGKTKGRASARAPRRMPVDVPIPFFLRRRAQVMLAFVVGILVVILAVWVTNGLRQQRADDKRSAQAADQRAAGQAWKGEVEAALGAIGTLTQGAPPTLLPTIGDTIGALDKGKVPDGAAETLQTAQDDATTASEAIQAYALVDQIRDKGMTEGQANYFLNSKVRIVEALDLYRQAAAVAELAAAAADTDRAPLVKRAKELEASADQILGEWWSDYQQALVSVQIVETPALPTGG